MSYESDSVDYVDRYTGEIGDYLRTKIPNSLPDATFAARASALMIALNRQLAATAVAFGEAHMVPPETVRAIVLMQFKQNYDRALAAVCEPVGTVQ